MKIGICSTDFAPDRADALFAKIHSIGFRAVQFSFGSILGGEEMMPQLDTAMISEVKTAAEKYGVEIVAVNCTFNMIDPDGNRLRENLRRTEVMCWSAKQLGCSILTLCTGSRNPESMWAWHEDNTKPEYWSLLMKVMRQVVTYAEQSGITLVVETEASNIVRTPALSRQMLDEINSPNLKMVIDCANLFLPGTAHCKNADSTIQMAFDTFGTEIALAHGKDIADSDGIEFVPAGEGIVNYDLFLRLLHSYGYRGAMILHGIYKEDLMPSCVSFISQKIRESAFELEAD